MANVKKIVGYRIGDFRTEDGNDIHFINLFCISPADGVVGLQSEKFKVDSDEVLEGIEFGQFAELYFNDKQKVVLIQPLPPSDDILSMFYELPVEKITEED